MITLYMFQSGYGDSLLVRLQQNDKSYVNVMIDLGFGYKEIAKRVESILDKEHIHRFIITHFDKDHIQGAAKLFSENGEYRDQKSFQIDQVWLNSYRHLELIERSDTEVNAFNRRTVMAYLAEKKAIVEEDGDEHEVSALQASYLASDLYKNGYCWNSDTSGKAICIENMNCVPLSDSTKLILLTPNHNRLKSLKTKFLIDLAKLNLSPTNDRIFDDAFEVFNLKNELDESAEEGPVSSSNEKITGKNIKKLSLGEGYTPDDSPANGSSISFILEHMDKKLLFLADAYAEDIIDSLKRIFGDNITIPLYFDAIKISHHGSFRNNSVDLFKLVDSERFLFSTNGKHPKHKHPDVQTISCIVNRPLTNNIDKRKLYFNYDLPHLEEIKQDSLQNEFNYQVITGTEVKIF